ncbi:MAG TPA: hypothetical protein VHI52_10420 [Verrucomicrobiae bacterium]|nr:hypothetical protein [Verrucomicrobiae bacterium]
MTFALLLGETAVKADGDVSGLVVTASIPAHIAIRPSSSFKAKLLVKNTTNKPIRFDTSGSSWFNNWKTDNAKFQILGWSCFWNPDITIEIQPGGSFTDEFEVMAGPKIAPGKATLRFGFSSEGYKQTSWSNNVTILIAPRARTPVELSQLGTGYRDLGKGCREVD